MLAIEEAVYGPNHPEVAKALSNLGNAEADLGDPAAARLIYQRALAIKEAFYGPDHPEVAKTLNNLGNAEADLGDRAAARLLLQRALGIEETFYGPNHPEVAATLHNLFLVLERLGQDEEAAGVRRRLQGMQSRVRPAEATASEVYDLWAELRLRAEELEGLAVLPDDEWPDVAERLAAAYAPGPGWTSLLTPAEHVAYTRRDSVLADLLRPVSSQTADLVVLEGGEPSGAVRGLVAGLLTLLTMSSLFPFALSGDDFGWLVVDLPQNELLVVGLHP